MNKGALAPALRRRADSGVAEKDPAVARTRRVLLRNPFIWVAALTVAALFVRLLGIGDESLWLDEAYTLLFSQLPIDRVITVGGAHEEPPLYYLLVHALMRVYDSPIAPRLVSALAGTASVPVLYALGARLFSRSAGFVAAMLLTISPFHFWYSQDGRAYTLAGLFVLLSYLCIFAALDDRSTFLWTAYALCSALALYSEYTAAFYLMPQALLLFRARQSDGTRPMLAAWGGTALLYAPWLGMLIANVAKVAGNYWIPVPSPGVVAGTVLEVLGLSPSCPTTTPCIPMSVSLQVVSGHAVLAAVVAGGAVLALLTGAVFRQSLGYWVVWLWLLFPFATVLLLSPWRSLFLDRVFLDTIFPFCLLLGAAVTRPHWSRWLAVGTAVVLAGASLYNLHATYATDSNGDWKALMQDLQATYRPGQAIVYYPSPLYTLGHAYVPATWHPTLEEPIWLHQYVDISGREADFKGLNDVQLRAVELREAAAHRRQLWVVTDWYIGQWKLHYWLYQHGFHMVVHEWFGGDAYLELWDREGPWTWRNVALPDDRFGAGWSLQGGVHVANGVAVTHGASELSRRFAVRPNTVYSLRYQEQSHPFAWPDISVRVYSEAECSAAGGVDGANPLRTILPIDEEVFQQRFEGRWRSQPFGFVTPPDAACAVLRMQTQSGAGSWRGVSVVTPATQSDSASTVGTGSGG